MPTQFFGLPDDDANNKSKQQEFIPTKAIGFDFGAEEEQ
jgi:hypothetical protein